MTDRKKPLPRPPRKGFGPKRGPATDEPLSADRMAEAMTKGKLDEYLSKEFHGNEQAQNLARMMMGLTGMSAMNPVGGAAPEEVEKPVGSPEVPEEIQKASLAGDMGRLMQLLKEEHEKRSNPPMDKIKRTTDDRSQGPPGTEEKQQPESDSSALLDRESIDLLIRIASENHVTLDWVIARAIKLYTRDYNLTGRV
jgi:hypothetical protein